MKRVRRDIATALGGALTPLQAQIADRCAWLSLRLAILDEKLAAGTLGDLDQRVYLAWSNSLCRALRSLGIDAAAAKPSTPLDAATAAMLAEAKRGRR